MMLLKFKSVIILLVFGVLLSSCGVLKKQPQKAENNTIGNIVANAQKFEGTRYKFGGTTRSGMDCSGLIYVAFQKENVAIPRVSRAMAQEGVPVSKGRIKKGDLIFFKTKKRSFKINHVGLVTRVDKQGVYFIHSTTSRGVITSSLNENYWNKAYVKARRVL